LAGFYGVALGLAVLPMPFTAWQRIAAGRHFLTDVIFSALLVALVAVLLAKAMGLHRRTPPVDLGRMSPL
jgi:membrane-associated phospholipid phosphatase